MLDQKHRDVVRQRRDGRRAARAAPPRARRRPARRGGARAGGRRRRGRFREGAACRRAGRRALVERVVRPKRVGDLDDRRPSIACSPPATRHQSRRPRRGARRPRARWSRAASWRAKSWLIWKVRARPRLRTRSSGRSRVMSSPVEQDAACRSAAARRSGG